jgi:hypothetical protein
MKSICQRHIFKWYLIDLRLNSNFIKQLPSSTLVPYLKELDDRIENLIPSNLHKLLTNFFQQNLTGEEYMMLSKRQVQAQVISLLSRLLINFHANCFFFLSLLLATRFHTLFYKHEINKIFANQKVSILAKFHPPISFVHGQ